MGKDIVSSIESISNSISTLWNVAEKAFPGIKTKQLKEEEVQYYIRKIRDRDDIDDIYKTAIVMDYKKMIRKWKRCHDVVELAEMYIGNNIKPNEVSDDWYENFFDKVQFVSDEYMKEIWAKILAGKMENPNLFSLSLLHTLSIMTKEEAANFCNVSRFAMRNYYEKEVINPLLFISKNIKSYSDSHVYRKDLLRLQNLGLVQCDFEREFVFNNKIYLEYGNKQIKILGDKNNADKILAGNAIFTQDGMSLYEIVGKEYKEYRSDILDFAVEKFLNRNCEVYINDKRIN